MPVTEETFRRLAMEDPEGHWELHGGRLRGKPGMSFRHNDAMVELGFVLRSQLDRASFRVRVNSGHVNRIAETYYIPDVFVVPMTMVGPEQDRPDVLEVYEDPLPLVVEVWSPSTGTYDVNTKIPEYQKRGDVEIWRLQPFDRTLTAWRRQLDGSYAMSVYHGGTVEPVALPGVKVDLDALFG